MSPAVPICRSDGRIPPSRHLVPRPVIGAPLSVRHASVLWAAMALLKWTLIVLLVGYVAAVAVLYFVQRALMYFPDPADLAGRRRAAGGGRDPARYCGRRKAGRLARAAARGSAGGALSARQRRRLEPPGRPLPHAHADGTGLVAVDYRGYGGSTGHPTETGLSIDAETAYAFAVARYPAARIAAWGELLGTGVATALAAERPIGRLVLKPRSPRRSISRRVDIRSCRCAG